MRIMLDPGHGGTDPGAVSNGYEEKQIALAIAREIDRLLEQSGHEVRLTRYDDSYVGLTQRCTIANRWPAELFVSIHLNADPDRDEPGMKEARGAEIWIYPGSAKGRAIAEKIGSVIRSEMADEPWRGVREGDLAVCRLTQMPACLIEVGFIDNSTTQRQLCEPAVRRHLAAVVAEGIVEYADEC